jgi:hypothetical protein
LRKSGLGNLPKAASPLTDTDINKFYDLQLLGNSNPEALLRTLHRNNMTYFGMRASQEHRNLCWGDVVLGMDPDSGLRYLELRTERITKTRQGENPRNKRQINPKAFEMANSSRCPVQSFLCYQEQRPQDYCNPDDPFYIATNHVDGGRWYKKQPVGIHKISKFVPMMVAAAGITDNRVLTNTSYRKQLAVRLNEGGVPKDVGRHVTGHKQAASLDNYAALSCKQQRVLSSIVGGEQQPTTNFQQCLEDRAMHSSQTSSSVVLSSSSDQHGRVVANSFSSVSSASTSMAGPSTPFAPGAPSSLFAGATIQGGTWNIEVHNHFKSATPAKRRNHVIYSSDED